MNNNTKEKLEGMKLLVKQLESELKTLDYDNSVIFSKNRIPERLSDNYSSWQNRVEQLVQEASKEFPDIGIDYLFKEAKKQIDPRRAILDPGKFNDGNKTMVRVLDMIEQNAIEDINFPSNEHQSVNTVEETINPPRNTKIFISYYSEQTLEEIKIVLETLDTLKTEIELDPSPYTVREQSIGLDALAGRVNDIKQCSGAIICLPPTPKDSPENFNNVVYFDLGACMTMFPEKILLLYESKELPRSFQEKVELFHFLGNLDFKKGMELAQKILQLFQE